MKEASVGPHEERIGLAQRVKRAVVRRLPASMRVALRDGYHRVRLRLGNDPLGEPAEHERFIAEHLGDLGAGPTGPLTYLEFGVYQGATLAAAVRGFDRAGVGRNARFVGFDSFEGLPPGSDREGWGEGWFVTSRRTAEWNLRRQRVLDRVRLVEGWFDETCTPALAQEIGRADIVMIDCDVYSATATAIEFVAPLLSSRAVVIFDDWYALNGDESPLVGQVRALHEWKLREPDRVFERIPGKIGFCGAAFVTHVRSAPAVTTAEESVASMD